MRQSFISVCAKLSSDSDMLTIKNLLNTAYTKMSLSFQDMFAAKIANTLTLNSCEVIKRAQHIAAENNQLFNNWASS